ncbi:MAG: transglutaminaseTgpA domain-containing protein, partial [Thermoanaerobacterium sp.]|nr:transglutaminaseTgpA domain-containing protein [Thermoanaerobacterium sp.]
MKIYTKKFNIIEYTMTSLLTVILSLCVFVGLNFKVDILEIISLSFAFVALLTIFLRRPQVVVTFLSIFILVDLYYFYMEKDVLTKAVLEIDKYVNWLYVYMSESNWPEGFNQLTSKYFFTTVLLGVFSISLVVTFLNRILKSYFLTMLFGILVLVFQWYNYVDKAYVYLVFYVAASFINMSVVNYQKAGNGKASIPSLLIIAILFSSISTAIAYTVPKNFHPVVWQALNDKFYAAFPFTKTWRNGIGSSSAANSFTTDFSSFSQDLGGPETVNDQVVMRVKADESLYLRGEVFDTYENNKWTNSVVQHSFGRDNYFQPEFDKNIKYTIKSMER